MSDIIYTHMKPGDRPDFAGYPCTLTAEEMTVANDLFQHYVFFQRDKKDRNILQLWTSCCQQEGVRYERLQMIMDSVHVNFSMANHNDEITCPYCGRNAILKDMARIGAAKSLEEYIPVVFLKAGSDGELYATGFWMWKGYDYKHRGKTSHDGVSFTVQPMYKITCCYKFEPGRATMHERVWNSGHIVWDTTTESLCRPRGRKKVKEPFTRGDGMYVQYCDYRVIGYEEIEKSAFKYCQYHSFRSCSAERYIKSHSCLMRYLAAASLYPKALEMLVKNGMTNLVSQLIFSKKKNADIINWEEADPRRAFGLNSQEIKTWMSMGKHIETLRVYKHFRKLKTPVSFSDAESLKREFYDSIKDFMKYCGKYHLKPLRLVKYLARFAGPRCHGGGITVGGVFRHWRDYIDAAVHLSYDLSGEAALMPRDIEEAHDTAVAEVNRRLNEARAEQNRRMAEDRAEAERQHQEELKKLMEEQARNLETRDNRFTFDMGDYIIRPARNRQEVVDEGIALSHCVGGYADRHVEGKLTICFLRTKAEPDKSLVTIELMRNGTMAQVHGFKNDQGTTPAKVTYDHILTPWLKWIAEGSKRDKEGKPILDKPARTRKKKEDHAA